MFKYKLVTLWYTRKLIVVSVCGFWLYKILPLGKPFLYTGSDTFHFLKRIFSACQVYCLCTCPTCPICLPPLPSFSPSPPLLLPASFSSLLSSPPSYSGSNQWSLRGFHMYLSSNCDVSANLCAYEVCECACVCMCIHVYVHVCAFITDAHRSLEMATTAVYICS